MPTLDTTPGRECIGGVRVKISITLPEELLKVIDLRAEQQRTSRSSIIEGAVQTFLGRSTWNEQNARDLEIINARADFLNQEARDVLEYAQS